MAKKKIRLQDIAQLVREVYLNEDEFFTVRALTLQEMIGLFLKNADIFLKLYSAGLSDKDEVEALSPFLISTPEMVAEIIALASDEPEGLEFAKRLPATVQLIALIEVWKASVPDPKKAKELLSEVTALLRKASSASQETMPRLSPAQLLRESISLSGVDTDLVTSGATPSPASSTT